MAKGKKRGVLGAGAETRKRSQDVIHAGEWRPVVLIDGSAVLASGQFHLRVPGSDDDSVLAIEEAAKHGDGVILLIRTTQTNVGSEGDIAYHRVILPP